MDIKVTELSGSVSTACGMQIQGLRPEKQRSSEVAIFGYCLV